MYCAETNSHSLQVHNTKPGYSENNVIGLLISSRDRDIWLFLFVRISSILLSPMNSCFTGLIQDRDIRAEPEFAHDSTVSGHCFDSIEKRTIQYTIMCTAHLTSSVIGRMRSRVL